MGKIIDTDDLMMNVELMIQKFKESRGTAAVSEHDLDGIREAYSMLCAMTRPANAADIRKREGEYTSFALVGNLGERLAVFSCAKCGEKIIHVTGTGEYKFCPFCGREKKE